MGAGTQARRPPAIARGARTNLALLGLLALAFVTGWLAFAFGSAPARWSLVVHAAGGFAILALLPWKSMIARRGLDRPRPGRWVSVLLGVLVLVSLVAGFLHSTGWLVYWGSLTAMEFHVGAALAAVPYAASEVVVRATGMPGAARRFTGSYEAGSFEPALMPVSSWILDEIPHIDPRAWRLAAGGRDWSYDELFAFDDGLTATLDCTGGFFSTQEWSGVRLDRLIGRN